MPLKSNDVILYSKVHSTFIYRKNEILPIQNLGSLPLELLLKNWFKLTILSSSKLNVLNQELPPFGYYSVFSNNHDLHLALLSILQKINLEYVISSHASVTEQEKGSYKILDDIINFLATNSK